MRLAPLAPALAIAMLAACASTPTATAPAVPAAVATPMADDTLNATVWYQTSVERDLIEREIYRAAGEKLAAALADKAWDALPKEDRDNDPRALPPAIIVDVDETVLDNSPSQVRQIRAGDGSHFDPAGWKAWVEQRAAKAIPGAVEFLQDAAKRGVTVYYISNRDAVDAQATFDNLRTAGFPIADASQFMGLGMPVDDCVQVRNDKSCRRRLVGRTHRVLMQFGDQLGDFTALADNSRAGRRAAMAAYADWIGQRWYVLPNPLYGSWESALLDGAKPASAAERRALKEAALDDASN